MDKSGVNNNFFEELLVVLVIYEMEINDSPAFNSLTTALQSVHQKTSIFIYDNSPSAHGYKSDENWITMYRHDSSNPGVSKAYNEGFNYAKSQQKKWMLLVDQDTEFEKNFFLKCKSAIEVNDHEKIFAPIMIDVKGIVSPFIFQFGRGVRLKEIKTGQYQMIEKKIINSGMLIECDLFEKAGGYDERFELDFSDLVFIQRLKKCQERFTVIDSTSGHNHSSQEKDFSKSKDRFSSFLKASRLFGDAFGPSFFLSINKFYRAIKFGFKFRSIEFLKMLIQNK